jgi:putative pyruvate formate lyase activating enzyme
MPRKPSYSYLPAADWDALIARLDEIASSCALCPRKCGVNRLKGERGFCGAPGELHISSAFPHHGEEPPLSGTGGSGTVFFSFCTLKCAFCQNFQISHEGVGEPWSVERLARTMIDLQRRGCHNINLVTATHFLPWVARALRMAAAQGLNIPIIYNCGGYELADVMRLLKDMVDVWLPDMKYGDDGPAREYSRAKDYVSVNQAAIREMARMAGPLRIDERGIAQRGLIIRHLVLPNDKAGSGTIVAFLKSAVDTHDIAMSVMAQYRPAYKGREHPDIARGPTAEEYLSAARIFKDAGFAGDFQEHEALDGAFFIDFEKRKDEPLTGR